MGKCVSKQTSAITIAAASASATESLSSSSSSAVDLTIKTTTGNILKQFSNITTRDYINLKQDNNNRNAIEKENVFNDNSTAKKKEITKKVEEEENEGHQEIYFYEQDDTTLLGNGKLIRNDKSNYRNINRKDVQRGEKKDENRKKKEKKDNVNNDCGLNNEGQSESKKSSKKSGPETKGTAMSFGFRKKLHITPKKKSSQEKYKQMESAIESESNSYQIQNRYNNVENIVETNDSNLQQNDNNGNSGSIVNTNRNAVQQTGGSASTKGPHTSSNLVYNRFGFRPGNVVRPASTGLTPKITDFQENVENNNNGYIPSSSSVKRRSKSAHTGRTMTSNRTNNDHQLDPKINQNINKNSNAYQKPKQPTHRYQQNINRQTSSVMSTQPSAIVNTGLHTNLIVRPIPRPPAATFSKFTLQTASLPKPQYPVPISLHQTVEAPMDIKTAKQMANNNRKGFFGPRDISADSGIASIDTTFVETNGKMSPTRGRNRPRNLQMVMSGRHKFEVRDLDESLSGESIVEPLALPKLPSAFSADNQTIPLSGLVRSNTVLTRESLASSTNAVTNHISNHIPLNRPKYTRNISNVEKLEEKQNFLDRSVAEKTLKNQALKDFNNSSKNSSPGSSRASWCNAGESLAFKDCSSISLSSSDDSKDNKMEKNSDTIPTDEISLMSLNEKPNLSSFSDALPTDFKQERPKTLGNINETKFAEMAAAASDFFLDDETSPTDSLVSSSDSDEAILKKQKGRINEEIQEKDLDEISPELEACSPFSPGTPTHASNSLSLSDVGRDFLIDDEIADQPALQFNEPNDILDSMHIGNNSQTDTPTLRESGSMKSIKSTPKSRSALQAAIEFSLRTPVSSRKGIIRRTESLDTLSPCESIASDDLMMDFDLNSSMDSIDRMSASIKSRSGSALHALDDSQLLAELESKGDDMIREWNNILRVHRTEKDSIISHLPARATRLLNRSRLQQQCHHQLSNTGSDSPKSNDSSLPRRTPPSRTSSASIQHNKDTNSSNDDLLLYDKSFRNSMVQDVLYFKKQLIRLRRILQDDEECLTRTETLNPFDINNGQIITSCDVDGKSLSDDKELNSLTASTSAIEQTSIQELSDLRRQVVYLQGQVEDRDRTIRMQRNIIEKLEAENEKAQTVSASTSISEKECVNTATQTDRVRPLSIGQDGLSRSKPEYTSYVTHFPAITTDTTIIHHSSSPLSAAAAAAASGSAEATTTTKTTTTTTKNQTRRHTIISTTFTNFNQTLLPSSASSTPRRGSIGWENSNGNSNSNSNSNSINGYKPVKITLIGEPLNSINSNNSLCNGSNNNNNSNNKINEHQKIDTNNENIKNELNINKSIIINGTNCINAVNHNDDNDIEGNYNDSDNNLIKNIHVINHKNLKIFDENNHKNHSNNSNNNNNNNNNNINNNCRMKKPNETILNGGGDCIQQKQNNMHDFNISDLHTPTVTIV